MPDLDIDQALAGAFIAGSGLIGFGIGSLERGALSALRRWVGAAVLGTIAMALILIAAEMFALALTPASYELRQSTPAVEPRHDHAFPPRAVFAFSKINGADHDA